MKHLVYLHQNLRPHIQVLFSWIHGQVTHWLVSLVGGLSLIRRRPYLLRWAGVVLSLVVQGVMLWMLAELIELWILGMEVWAELATYHFAMTGRE